MMMPCIDCDVETADIVLYFNKNNIGRCHDCHSSYLNRLYWAQKPIVPTVDHYSNKGGACFFCDIPSLQGLLREISRDGNSEKCPTWVCWPCHVSRPTLFNFIQAKKDGEE